MLKFSGNGGGVGQILAAVTAALLLRLFSGPGPAYLPETETEEEENDGAVSDDEASVSDKVYPVTIRWTNITCGLSDKASKSVSFWFYDNSVVLFNACWNCSSGIVVGDYLLLLLAVD